MRALVMDAFLQFVVPELQPAIEVNSVRWALNPDDGIGLEKIARPDIEVGKQTAMLNEGLDGFRDRKFAAVLNMDDLSGWLATE